MALTMGRWKRQKAEKKSDQEKLGKLGDFLLFGHLARKMFPEMTSDEPYGDERAEQVFAIINAYTPEERQAALAEAGADAERRFGGT